MQDDWRDITTAPKDGTEILVCDLRGWRCVASWDSHVFRGEVAGWRDGQCYSVNPTHWQPLPSPPALPEKG